MRLSELNGCSDYGLAAARAYDDLMPLAKDLELAQAHVQRTAQRLREGFDLQQKMMQRIGETAEALKKAKTRAFLRAGASDNGPTIWDEVNRLKGVRENLAGALSYHTSWTLADLKTASLAALIIEAEAEANLLEARACAARAKALSVAVEMNAHDPGINVTFAPVTDQNGERIGNVSASGEAQKKVLDIRGRDVPRLRAELNEHHAKTEAEQNRLLTETPLFN